MKIGAQLYSLREHMKDSEGILKSLEKVKKMGYESVQLSGIGRMDVHELKAKLDELSLDAICTHIPFDAMRDKVKEVAQAHKLLGCKYVGLGAMPGEYRNEEGFYAFARDFDEIAKVYEAEGLKVTYHNHDFEFVTYGGKCGMDILLENSEKFLFLPDTFWIQAGGGDVIQWLEKLAHRTEIVHFKDYGIERENDEWAVKKVFREIGSGNLNWNGIIDTCADIGVTHVFVEQDDCYGRDEFECLEKSCKFLKEKFAKYN